MVSRFMARRAATIGETVQIQQLSGKWEEQAQHLSAGTAQPEDQQLGGGISSGFVGIGILAVVVLIVAFFGSKLHSKGHGGQANTKATHPTFTVKDRVLIELLSSIVDIISSVEK